MTDTFVFSITAADLRQIPHKPLPATDKLRLAWQLLADAFRHPHLRDSEYDRLRVFVTPTYHMRYSEPLAFLGFAAAVDRDDHSYSDAVNSTGFRDAICNRGIQAVADWIESIADRVDDQIDSGYLGLIVDETLQEVRRHGFRSTVKFEPSSAEWHMFLCGWKAGHAGSTARSMAEGYPGDPAPNSRKTVKQNVNEALAALGVRLAPNIPPKLEVSPASSRRK